MGIKNALETEAEFYDAEFGVTEDLMVEVPELLLNNIMNAIAELDVVFPSSELSLRENQIKAINTIKDISHCLTVTDPSFNKLRRGLLKKKMVEDVKLLHEKGSVDEKTMNDEICRIEKLEERC